VLSGDGASVIAAANASEAFAMFVSWMPDVVVSDIALGDEDGLTLMRRIRARDTDVRAVAVSGHDAPRDVERAYEAGFDAHLTKPVDPRALVRLVHELATDPSAVPKAGNRGEA
jgi:CheY-like chemotaxis protein